MADWFPLVFSSGWASGVNAYAVVLLSGLLGRFAGVDAVPAGLQRTDVLIGAAVLFALEFVADKIPYLDSLWDSVHTVVRPTVGAILGLLATGEASSPEQALAATTGGATALASHVVKAGLRLAVNTSPEPASNIVVSVLEDLVVAAVVVLGLLSPVTAAVVAAILLATGLLVLLAVRRMVGQGLRRWRERRPAL